MAKSHIQCRNCQTQRRLIQGRGLCSKCYYWQGQVEDYSEKLELVRAHPEYCGKYRPTSLFSKLRVARRVLEELRWREEGLHGVTVDSPRLESLVCALARDCKSKVTPDTTALIEQMTPESRRQIYEVMLTIVEHLPSRLPNLHSLDRPCKGAYYQGGWLAWHGEHHRSEAFGEEVKVTRELERAYYESLNREENHE